MGRMSFKRKLVIALVIIAGGIKILSILMPEEGDVQKNQTTKTEISINGDVPDFLSDFDEDTIADSEYYDTIEESLRNAKKHEGQEYMNNMDEVIFELESEDYVTVYYRSIKDEKSECFTMAKFKKKEIDGKVKYAPVRREYCEANVNSWYTESLEENLESNMNLFPFFSILGPDPEKRFFYGDTKDEKIFKLKIEGQEPTEIIPYESFGEQWYFYYYEDLKSDKPGSQLEFTVE